jgi:hypothetical protein
MQKKRKRGATLAQAMEMIKGRGLAATGYCAPYVN